MAADKIKNAIWVLLGALVTGVDCYLSAELTQQSARGLLQTKWSAFIAAISQ